MIALAGAQIGATGPKNGRDLVRANRKQNSHDPKLTDRGESR
jgi:hypothetical protein